MAPPHRCVALMVVVAAAALLLTLDAAVASGRAGNPVKRGRGGDSAKFKLLTLPEAERGNTLKVLQAFAAAMPSLGWSGDDFCSWSGVTCFDANVSVIITGLFVTGTLPEMPDDVDYSMVRLDEIYLFGQRSGITGTLPDSWGKLREVRTVSLGYMSINGTLPVSWASMRSLRFLRLRSVNVSGTLPAAWSSMEAMEEIMIFNTGISGTLPEVWSTMPNLSRIYLERCNLYGSLPESWARMPSLEHLSLRNNNLCGCVPETWLTSPTLLVSVDTKHLLKNCTNEEACVEVTTTRPRAQYDPRCEVAHCISCLARDSKLCGVCIDGYVLTDDLQCMQHPEWDAAPFTVSEAERGNTLKVLQAFAAAMPSLGWSGDDFCSWSGVTCLDANVSVIITGLFVTGTLPEMPDDVDYSMVRLDHISIFGQDSRITGTLPSSWGKLREVRTVSLGYMSINGTLPVSWASMRSLRFLRLRSVNVSGTLPAAWSSMEAMEEIMMFNTGITGTLPEAWSTMPNLSRIDLERCNLYGSLPESWARMPSLEHLSLRNNNLCGCVPETLLTSPTLLVSVDTKHLLKNCTNEEACVEVTTTRPRAQYDPRCEVAHCITCLPRDSNLCGVCIDGYVLTDDWQCMQHPEWDGVPLGMSDAERLNTLKVLQAFAAAMPSLGWRGSDFCSWSAVRCLGESVSVNVSRVWVAGTLPEMPDDVDYAMVKLNEISFFRQEGGLTGTLPSSWSKLRKLRKINLAYAGISGTLPAAWRSMEAVEQIMISNTQVSGALPETWSAMLNLRRIYLQGCSLHGSLPDAWAEMPSLESLDLRKNNFCGCVPLSWLMSGTLWVDVDTRHKYPHCLRAEACVETTTPEPIGSSVSSTATTEVTTLSPPSDHQCTVPNCVSCRARDSKLCGVCVDGYVLTDDLQCMKGPEWETAPYAISEAEWWNTLKVLQAFAAALPSLGWSGGDFCSWSGVRCLADYVSVIISRSGVTGTLPEMPDDVDYSMVRLDHISIFGQDSGITGTLPSSWGLLRKVRTVSLGYMSINATLPVSWASMRSLRFLRLRSVNVSGTLPAAWSSMEAMEEIMIFNTGISGTLPEAWSSMPKLARIDLERCNLYGSLPESWARMPSLELLSLRNNDLCGCVPETWLTSPTLFLSVDTKHLLKNCTNEEACVEVTTTRPLAQYDPRCEVPYCIWCLPRDSKLCGVCMDGYVLTYDWQCMKGPEWDGVPLAMSEGEWWNTLKVLQAFAAAMPSLGWSGGDFCSWRGVTCLGDSVSVFLARSGVTGTLPEMPDDVDYSMVNLEEVSIFRQHSGLTGTLPSSWGKLRKVRKINLADTGITGTLPQSWRKLGKVRKINLAYTGITGTLPESWGKLCEVQTINLSYTGISGTLPAAWSSMEAIEQIIISSTQITGTLPEAWHVLPKLRRIRFQRCKLYGPLPESWAQMPSLERLELLNNHFCGCVPQSWLRSPTLVIGVDGWNRMASCATADACTEIGSTQSTTSNYDNQDG